MSTLSLQDFGPLTPVEPGITLLEASAGTGKTYQITNLVLRLLVDNNVTLPRILIVTFTKAATAELKDRVRQRLVEAQRAVELLQAPSGDLLLQRYVQEATDDPERARTIRARLRRAREAFDLALISTIHGFCQRMLQLHAFETGTAFGRTLETDSTETLQTIVDDWLVRRLHDADEVTARLLRDTCGIHRKGLLSLARQATSDPDMPVVPRQAPIDLVTWLKRVAAIHLSLEDDTHPAAQLTRMVAARSGDFCGRTYGSKAASERLEVLKQWAASPTYQLKSNSPQTRWFTATQLQAKARTPAGKVLASHPFFTDYESILRLGEELATGEHIAFVQHARAALAEHHRARDTQSFHDLLRDLDHVLQDPSRGPQLCEAIRSRFDAALIDEFQDTDAQQWRIFGRVFGGIGAPTNQHYLYLIGDPKQAIYGFRGANVHVYLAARDQAATHRRFTMRRNYRSDGRLIHAMNLVLDRPGIFGGAGIDYIAVSAHHTRDRLTPGPHTSTEHSAPLQLVWADGRALGGDAFELLGNTQLNELLAAGCASELVDFLESGTTIEGRSARPGDCAVLVRSHHQAAAVHTELLARGVPAVISSQGQVFDTAEALSLQRWLHALAQPGNESAARVLAADPLLAWSAAELPNGADGENPRQERWWNAWLTTLTHWRSQFQRHGFYGTFRSLLDHPPPWSAPPLAVGPRLLGTVGGERRMTDLLHLAELLHSEHVQSGAGLMGLHSWLERQRHEGARDADAAELKLETDAEAVQVVTIHKSKGLQYGVVFAPFLWKDEGGRNRPPLVAPHPTDATLRQLVLSTIGPQVDDAVERADSDSREEGARLLYVALTRARHRCVVYCPGLMGSRANRQHGPLAAILHGASPSRPTDTTDRIQSVVERFEEGSLERADAQWAELAALAAQSEQDGTPTVALRVLQPPNRHRWAPPEAPTPHLAARSLSHSVDDDWRRHSYSALTRASNKSRFEEGIDPARGLGFDDDRHANQPHRAHTVEAPLTPANLSELPDVPLAGFPAGADAGTCLHAIFEHLDFRVAHPDSTDLETLEAVASRELHSHGFSAPTHLEVVKEGFPGVLTTPLGPLLPTHRLCDIAPEDRLDELRFDFPVAGGEDFGHASPPQQRVTAQALRDALALRGPDPTVPMEWIDQVAGLGFSPLAGMMTGSIDLVFRVPSTEDDIGRWFVVDYKSNRLDPHNTGRTPREHFSFAGMRYEMAHHHYFLQYHIYCLALHRFLKARLGDRYRYKDHFGGVAYLFVRGMTGDASPSDTHPGVFTDRPPLAVIDGLDRVFDGKGIEPCT